MIEIKPKMSEVGQERMLVELAHLYKNPLHALREYVTNAVDAHGADRRKGTFQDGLVNVDISPQDRRLIITDNASGMSEALMRVLPIRIGDSLKAGKPDQRGEKAVGLLAFGSMGGRCVDIISRGEGDVGYNHLRYTLEGKEEGNECLRAQFERLTSCDVERNFHGGFDRGTRVLVKTTTEVLKEKLTAPKIRRFLQGTYTPLLRAGWLPFWVCDISRNEQEIVDAPTFTGTLLRTERAGGFNAGSKRHPDESGLEVYLFFDPSSDSGSVPFFSKDVRVYDRITDLDDDLAETTLWGCGNVSGYANDPDLKLTLGRESIDFVRNTRTYRSLIKYLMDLDRELKPTIESLTNTHRKEKGNKVLEDAWKLLQKAYQETEPINIVRRGGGGAGGEPRTVEPGEEKKTRERKKRIVPFITPIVQGFDLEEGHYRSKPGEQLGRPVPVVNGTHPDYKKHVVQGSAEDGRRYLVTVAATPMAMWEVKDAIKHGKPFADEYEIAAEVARRAQDLAFRALNGGGR